MNESNRDPLRGGGIDGTHPLAMELDGLVKLSGFPRIRSNEDVKKLDSGDYEYASYSGAVAFNKGAGRIFEIALRRASDPDDPVFCRHGAGGHQVFFEAVNKLQEVIRDGSRQIIVEERYNQSTQEKITRLHIESPDFSRKTFIPGILYEYEYWAARGKNVVENQLKKIARGSVAGAILYAFYAGKSIDNVFSLLQNLELNQRIPTKSKQDDISMLGKVRNLITVTRASGVEPVPDASAFWSAVELLSNGGFLVDGEAESPLFQFKEKVYPVKARAVFEGMTTIAVEAARINKILSEPLNRYIYTKFGNIFTTQLLTAFFPFANE